MSGFFVMWIDVELAWGLVHRKEIDLIKMKRISLKVREILDALFALLEKYEMPVTWSILGHLMLDSCNRERANRSFAHPEMPRARYSWLKSDWYRYDPCTDVHQDPAWYGKDIVDRIVEYVNKSKLGHDVGCHSFSHQQFGDPRCTEEVARAEIQRCVEIMNAEYGIVPKTFTFPRDYVGHVNLLKEFGFVAFRDVPPKFYPCLPLEKTFSNYAKTYLSLFFQLMSYYFLFPPHVATLRERIPGVWSLPGCLPYGKKQMIPQRFVTFKAVQGIKRAIQKGKFFSMYMHLKDFGEKGQFFSNVEKVLSFVKSRREKGELEVRTLMELVKEF